MENFYNYTIENYTLSGEAKRMLDSLVLSGDGEMEEETLPADPDVKNFTAL